MTDKNYDVDIALLKDGQRRIEDALAAERKAHAETKKELGEVKTQLRAGVWSVRVVATIGGLVATYFGLGALFAQGPKP